MLDEAKKLLQEYGVAQDDLILMQRKAVGTPAAGAGAGAASPARYIFLMHIRDLYRLHITKNARCSLI